MMSLAKKIIFLLVAFTPLPLFAVIGVSPAAVELSLPRDTYEDGVVTFMRTDKELDVDMNVSVFSDNAGFILTEGITYFMAAGEKELRIPYRIDSHTYKQGTYKGILYIRPEKVTKTSEGNVRLIVQGGVRMTMIVNDQNEIKPWYTRALENARDHLFLYGNTLSEKQTEISARIANLIK